jgi:hypothetical protein
MTAEVGKLYLFKNSQKRCFSYTGRPRGLVMRLRAQPVAARHTHTHTLTHKLSLFPAYLSEARLIFKRLA